MIPFCFSQVGSDDSKRRRKIIGLKIAKSGYSSSTEHAAAGKTLIWVWSYVASFHSSVDSIAPLNLKL